MTDLVFVDTNIVIYTRDQRDPGKAAIATEWLRVLRRNDAIVFSPQVLNETFAVATAKFRLIGPDAILAWVRQLLPYCTAPLDRDTVATALELHERHALAWWNCSIVASALAGGCRYLLSEDMQHRQIIRTLEIINPFRTTPSELLEQN